MKPKTNCKNYFFFALTLTSLLGCAEKLQNIHLDPLSVFNCPEENIPIHKEHTNDANEFAELGRFTFQAINKPATKFCHRITVEESNTLAWETWKQQWEAYQEEPSEWKSYNVKNPPCDILKIDDQEIEVTPDKWPKLFEFHGGTVLDFINTVTPRGRAPVIDRNGKPIRYEIRFNEVAYNKIRECFSITDAKAREEACRKIVMPAAKRQGQQPLAGEHGSIVIKASWRQATEKEWHENIKNKKYHARELLDIDYNQEGNSICGLKKWFLIGMHIIYKSAYIDSKKPKNTVSQKTLKKEGCPTTKDKHPKDQWLWITFEHRENTALCTKISQVNNSLTVAPFDRRGYVYMPNAANPGEPIPTHYLPTNVCRTNPTPLHMKESDKKLSKAEEPWKHYRPIALQWLRDHHPTPCTGVANSTLETYVQNTTCQKCHRSSDYDHLQSLGLHFKNQESTNQESANEPILGLHSFADIYN